MKMNGSLYKVVLIDIDDTLLDFRACAHQAVENCFRTFGLPFSEEAFQLFEVRNLALWKRLEKKEITKEQLFELRWQIILDELGLTADTEVFEWSFLHELGNASIPIPGALELLRYLSGKYRVCAATNGMLAQQTYRLKNACMLPYLEHVFASESFREEKPSAGFFDACFRVLNGVDVRETVLIGDSLSADISGALLYGLPCIWFNRYEEDRNPPEGVLRTVRTLDEIKQIL